MSRTADARFMALALSLGRRGMGRVWPNPAVGCVIVKNGRIVGRARTADGGRPHAEPQALAQAGDAARGATVYVTLEPCSHVGQTPPCADALVAAGVARVVVAAGDPNPLVSGQGIDRLRAAGITVDLGCLAEQAEADHAGFFSVQTGARPFVTLKLAMTLDGQIATANGDSQWITGPEARRMVHGMRARHDAVMVGAGTVRADNPRLNVRGFGQVPQPVAVVLSSTGVLPKDGYLAKATRPVWVCHGAGEPSWGSPVKCALKTGQLDLVDVLTRLADRGLTRVFCEGGGQIAGALLRAGLVDELVVFQGGKLIGSDGRPGIGELGLDVLRAAPGFDLIEHRRVGDDILHRWRPQTLRT